MVYVAKNIRGKRHLRLDLPRPAAASTDSRLPGRDDVEDMLLGTRYLMTMLLSRMDLTLITHDRITVVT